MMQMLNEHAHKNQKEVGGMPNIIDNLEENLLSAWTTSCAGVGAGFFHA